MSMGIYFLPLLALPLGEGAAPFVNAHRFMGGAPWFENCDNLTVDNNLAFSNTTPLGNGIDKRLRGFSVDNTTNSNFCSNKAEQMGSGVWVYNKCAGTTFKGMNNSACIHGFHLVNADLPRQGTDLGGGNFSGWENVWTQSSGIDIAGATFNTLILDWDYDQNTPFGNPALATIYVAKHGWNVHDQNCTPAQGPRAAQRDAEFGGTVMDTVEYNENFIDENKYADKEQFYNKASDDSTYLSLGASNDAVYQQEYDSLTATNVGVLREVEQQIKGESYSTASALNQIIVPSNQSEQNKKEVNEITLYAKAHFDSIDSARKETLTAIAVQDIIHGGEAVIEARARLNKDVIDDPVGYYRLSKPTTETQHPVLKGKIIPNPVSDAATFNYTHADNESVKIKTYDAFNNEIAEYKLISNSIAFKTSELKQAVYFIHVYVNELETETHRLIIIR